MAKFSREKCKQFLEENGFKVIGDKLYYNVYLICDYIVDEDANYINFNEIMNCLNGVDHDLEPECDVDVFLTMLFKNKDKLLED